MEDSVPRPGPKRTYVLSVAQTGGPRTVPVRRAPGHHGFECAHGLRPISPLRTGTVRGPH